MKYQKIINLSENTLNQPSKFRTKNWIEVIDESRGTHNVNSQIKFNTEFYVIMVMHIYLWVQLQQIQTQQQLEQQQTIEKK